MSSQKFNHFYLRFRKIGALFFLAVLAAALAFFWLGGSFHKLAAGQKNKILPAISAPPVTAGNIDIFEVTEEDKIHIAGWSHSTGGVGRIAVSLDGKDVFDVSHGLLRADVEAAYPQAAGARNSGFDGVGRLPGLADGIHTVVVNSVDLAGGKKAIFQKTIFPKKYIERWKEFTQGAALNAPKSRDDIFFIPVATSNVAAGGAAGIKQDFAEYESDTVKIGMRVQILYLRTTTGKAGDYAFDPDFVIDKKCGSRLIAEDSLNETIRFSIENKLPVLFTLNGGIWADSTCEAIDWDINDVLERDEQLCQWNEKNQVMPDNALVGQPGSFESPELGRSLSLNIYAEKARFYKKRNLQQAVNIIQDFAKKHPDLFIGVNLDPDVYINPFFEGKQWYDYNPATLRQFREWLQGSGPYAQAARQKYPDLVKYRKNKPLTLTEVSAIAGKAYASWDDVDPPREFPALINPFWKNPWVAEWEHFKRQLVGLHYDELSQWVAQAGIDKKYIYSSQGFMAPGALIDSFPISINSPAKNYDGGGMSIQGSVPSAGNLGAIIYGKSAVNDVRMEGSQSLFAEFRQHSPEWAVVEHNTADLLTPKTPATYGEAYRSLRDMWNYGARFVSPMAWNGSAGSAAGTDGFLSYTSLRRSPLEEAIQHFMLSRANLPRSARLWQFGSVAHLDADQWTVNGKPPAMVQSGSLALSADATGTVVLVSPGELAWKAGDFDALVIQSDVADVASQISIETMVANGSWQVLVPQTAWGTLVAGAAGTRVPLPRTQSSGSQPPGPVERIRITWRAAPGTSIAVRHIALIPAARGG